jgi:hypothetical protein
MSENLSLYHLVYIHLVYIPLTSILLCIFNLIPTSLSWSFFTVMNPHRLNGIYRLERKIGSGTFGMQTAPSANIFGLAIDR